MQGAGSFVFYAIESHVPDFLTPATAELSMEIARTRPVCSDYSHAAVKQDIFCAMWSRFREIFFTCR